MKKMLKVVLFVAFISSIFVNAAVLSDVRFNNMKPVILCDKNAMCDGDKASNIRLKHFDHNITHVKCTSLKNCGGTSPTNIRIMQLKPMIECNTKGVCGKNKEPYSQANLVGVVPVVPCTPKGNCKGLSPADVRLKGMVPIVLCNKNGQCK